MNHLFIRANSNFKIGEYVEFIGENIKIEDLANEDLSVYELILRLK